MIDKNYDEKGNAAHYDTERVNTIRAFEKIYGTLAVMYFCEINALKYRMRVGKKEGNSAEQELIKAKWYEDAAAYYFRKINENKEISVWNTTHVGAHRFSANVVMLPEGIYYGRVNPENVNHVIESHLKGQVYLDCFRGRSCFSQISQVSDYFLRGKIAKLGIYDIKWEFEKDRDVYTAVEFGVESEGLVYSVNSVVLNDAIKVLPSCGDDEARYLPLFYFYSLIPYTPKIKDNNS